MVKKITSVFFLWMAGLVMIAHAVIPHHHSVIGEDKLQSCISCSHYNSTGQINNQNLPEHSSCPNSPVIANLGHSSTNHQGCIICNYKTGVTHISSKFIIDTPACSGSIILKDLFPCGINKYYKPDLESYSYLFAGDSQSRAPPSFC